MEQTAKNILLRAIRRKEGESSPKDNGKQLQQFKTLLGLEEIYSDRVLG